MFRIARDTLSRFSIYEILNLIRIQITFYSYDRYNWIFIIVNKIDNSTSFVI